MYNNIAEASSTLNRLLPIESLVHTKKYNVIEVKPEGTTSHSN